jgi:hypothetical protein
MLLVFFNWGQSQRSEPSLETKPGNSKATAPGDGTLLDLTLGAASRDRQTVSIEGAPVQNLIDGVSIREVPTHTDERGSVVEI